MAEVNILAIAGSLLGKLGPYAFEETKSCWRADDDLQRLVNTIKTIRAGLLDAENYQDRQQPQSKLVRDRLDRLKNALYDADDLFDEVFTNKAFRETLTGKEKVVEEIHRFFSKSSPIILSARIARKIKKIRRELDDIIKDMELFKFEHRSSNCANMSSGATHERETISMPADVVIGREEDASKLSGLLLNPESKDENFPDVISIVGFGGLGKTSLAQLLYNNEDVKANFELQAWACISDTVQTKEKAEIVLKALRDGESITSSTLEQLRLEIGKKIMNRRYLLVLDDYWDDDLQRWIDLRSLFRGGKRGSKIVVTTRSSRVTDAMDADSHDLKGLADDKAEELFERWAFRSAVGAENKDRLMEMGRVIVRKCGFVPLAIKAVASLLNYYRGDEKRWKSVMDSDLLTLDRNQNMKILPVLKLSYDNLPSHLKPCFALCSVFPKSYWISGETLVDYWIAQGYIEHCSDGELTGLRKEGGDYLRKLTSRSFLQYSHVLEMYCMHDLMHDLAQEVAREEVLAVNNDNFDLTGGDGRYKMRDARIRHLSSSGVQIDDGLLTKIRAKYLRSFIQIVRHDPGCSATRCISAAAVKELAVKFSSLRLLVLRGIKLEWLPSSIGELMRLRCLVISENKFKRLPDEITKLHNLKILDVSRCFDLESLPDNLNKLINLSCLVLYLCSALTSMPRKFGKLTSLECLDMFIVGDSSLEALVPLVNLRGRLNVEYRKRGGGGVRGEKTLDLSSSLVHLDDLRFVWPGDYGGPNNLEFRGSDGGNVWEMEGIEFECSQLPPNLKRLTLYKFPGQKLPEWEKSFNNLSEVYLSGCTNCKYLPSFGRHPRIRVLQLFELGELEYIEAEESDEFAAESHFRFLWRLELRFLHKLKAWSPGMEKLGEEFRLQHMSSSASAAVAAAASSFPRFHSLSRLWIYDCPKLTSMPLLLEGSPHIICDQLKEPLRTLLTEQDDD